MIRRDAGWEIGDRKMGARNAERHELHEFARMGFEQEEAEITEN
jgi:hypothetical protein